MRIAHLLALTAFAALAPLAGACSKSSASGGDAPLDASASAGSAASASASAAESSTVEPGNLELKPVYPADAGAPNPLATRFCDAVYGAAGRRAQACCPGAMTSASTPAAIAAQCVRTLTAALASHAVTLAEDDVDRCTAAVTAATTGCDWVTPDASPEPAECDGIIKGALKEKAACRSSLECETGLRCQGLSAIDVGTCAPPKVAPASCNVAVDMLASFTRQDRFDRAHPECAGYCRVRECKAAVAPGGACAVDVECGAGRCEAGKCTTAPLPAAGEACTASCAAGLRCAHGKCAAPAAEGASCGVDAECRGSCVRPGDASTGTCAKSCARSR